MTDPTQGQQAAPNIFQQIENTLSADWAKVTAIFQEAEAFAADFLGKVAAGAEIVIADIEKAASYVAGNLTVINAQLGAVGALASVVAPNNATVQKVLSDVSTAVQDVADLHNALTSGSSSGDPTIVTQAVTAINSVNQIAQAVTGLSTTLGTLAANSSSATEAVTQGAPQTPAS